MGIFDFVKNQEPSKGFLSTSRILLKKFWSLKRKKIEQEITETIGFTEINTWVEDKKQLIIEGHKQPKQEINETLSNTVQEFENSVEVLRNLDLTNKKAPERAKLIVEENLSNFTYYLEKLISNLKEINQTFDSTSFEKLINKLNSVFSNFEKKSIMSFQKSTFLIGEELGKVRDIISSFFKSFNKIINENKPSIEKIKTISIIKEKLKQINDLEKINSENEDNILGLQEKIKFFEQDIQELEDKINQIKDTQEYAEQVNNKNELEKLKTTLIIEFQALKDLIDFKALSKIYHSIENKMNLIKDYKENFKGTFEKHEQEKFLDLIDIKQINKEPIKKRIDSINNLKQNINDISLSIEKDLTKDLEKEIQEINRKITELHLEISKKQRLNNKFKENQEQIKQEVIKQAESLNLIVEG